MSLPVFKTGEAGDPGLAGSIPVRLRQACGLPQSDPPRGPAHLTRRPLRGHPAGSIPVRLRQRFGGPAQGARGSWEAEGVRKLTFGMNVSVDGYIAAPGDDLGWSVPSDELFQWWSDRVGETDLALYGRKLWETMSSYWPTAEQQPEVTPAEIEFANRWLSMPKVVFSSTISSVDWNTRLFAGDAVPEISRLKAEDGGPMEIAGATLAAAAMRAGLIDEYLLATAPVLLGAGTPFFTALDNWMNLTLVETRTFPDGVVLTRYETRR